VFSNRTAIKSLAAFSDLLQEKRKTKLTYIEHEHVCCLPPRIPPPPKIVFPKTQTPPRGDLTKELAGGKNL
jgi:hypothetical protein